MGSWTETFVASVVSGLAASAVPADVEPMTAYMRHQFPFLGVKALGRRRRYGRRFQRRGGQPTSTK